jgi:iron-sulfur cluster assembly protein
LLNNAQMITLTTQAAQQVIKAAGQAGAQGSALRIAARVDDDGSVQYGMGFDEQCENDMLIYCEGVAVLVAPGSTALLKGVTLDFVELDPGEFQFIFIPPAAAGSPAQ